MMAPEDVLLEAMTAAVRYDNAPWLRKQMCAKLRESIRVEGNYLAVPFWLPVTGDEALYCQFGVGKPCLACGRHAKPIRDDGKV